MDKEHLNVAVVGTGPWGNQHLISFDRNRHTKLCAVVGRDEIKTREIAGRYNIRPYTDIREMYRSEKVDLVSICLNGMHNYLDTLYAIRQGVPLLIEKPLSFSLAEGERLLQEIERTHTFVSINFMHRFGKPVQYAYKAIQKNKLGDPLIVLWKLEHQGSCADHEYRNLIESQCHGLDLIEHLCGEIESVMAEMTNVTQKGCSSLSVAFKLKNGGWGVLLVLMTPLIFTGLPNSWKLQEQKEK